MSILELEHEHIAERVYPDPMLPEPFRVQQVTKDTHDTFSWKLEPYGDHRPFRFFPGQFNMLYVFGVGEVPISISGDPDRPKTLVHTIRTVGTVTKAMRKLKRGDVLGVRGPFGNAWPVKDVRGDDVVLVAGGIGLAPIRPALYHVLAHREKYGRVVVLYGARTPRDILYRRELENWRARFDLDVEVTVDYADGTWLGNVGVVTELIPRAPFDPLHTTAIVCGPEIMMRFTAAELEKRSVPLDKIYVSLERNMKCGTGFCGHCQYGPTFICRDGPVYRYSQMQRWIAETEV